MITIFTPVYNRVDVIGRLYQSLLRQTDYHFEWLIINDGSTDSIAEAVSHWIETKEAPFPIRFYQQENGGKHRAINRGVQLAQGDAFFIVDSDDYLTEDAVDLIGKWWKDIENDDCYAGIAGLRGNRNGDVIGELPLFEEYIDATNMERASYGLLGDKAEVYKTSVLKKEPFPEFVGENFLTEAVVWDKLAYQSLKIRWFNRVIYVCEYRPDGLTSQGWKTFVKNPIGWGLYIQQKCQFYYLDEEKKIGKYLEYYIFMKGQLSGREMSDYLGIEEEKFEKIKEYHEQCIKRTVSYIGKNLGVYGVGKRGKKVWKLYEGTEVHISFILDKKKVDMPCRQIDLSEKYPKVDAIIVTPKDGQGEIFNFLAKRTENRLISYDEWNMCVGVGGTE